MNCSFQNKKLKKQRKKRHITCQMHTNYAQRKRKITKTLKRDDTVTNEVAHVIN